MNGGDYANLAYLAVLLLVIGFWFFIQSRASLGKNLQYAVIWGLIFLGVLAAVGLWDSIRDTVLPRQTIIDDQNAIEIPLQADGHYYMTLLVNDVPVRFVIDTGATQIVLRRADAERIGIDPARLVFLGEAMTANGVVKTAPVTLDKVSVGPITDWRVEASVNGGELGESLLGMSYLNRFERIEITGGRMVLHR